MSTKKTRKKKRGKKSGSAKSPARSPRGKKGDRRKSSKATKGDTLEKSSNNRSGLNKSPHLYCVGGWDGEKILDTAQYFDFADKKWYDIPQMYLARSALSAGVIKGKLYVTGGWDFVDGKIKIYWQCECYDPITKAWSDFPSLEKERRGHSSIVYKDRMYVFGGEHPKEGALSDVSIYDPVLEKWSVSPSMCTSRRYLATVILNEKIYAIGGRGKSKTLKTVECFDPVDETWDLKKEMNSIRYGAAACTIGKFIYVVGGWDGDKVLNDAERYDPEKNTWTNIESMSGERREMGSIVYADEMYIIGGSGEEKTEKITAQKYNPEKKKWEMVENMTVKRGALAVAIDYNPQRLKPVKEKYDPLPDLVPNVQKSVSGYSRFWCCGRQQRVVSNANPADR